MKNIIGLDKEKASVLANELNVLLSDYQVYYQNLRGFHWNITGPNFFELHIKFEELYTDAQTVIDDLAERIVTLGETPIHTFSEYLEKAEISEAGGIRGDRESLEIAVQNLGSIIAREREITKTAAATEDEGTLTLLTDDITAKEKVVWMLSAYLK